MKRVASLKSGRGTMLVADRPRGRCVTQSIGRIGGKAYGQSKTLRSHLRILNEKSFTRIYKRKSTVVSCRAIILMMQGCYASHGVIAVVAWRILSGGRVATGANRLARLHALFTMGTADKSSSVAGALSPTLQFGCYANYGAGLGNPHQPHAH